MKTPQEFNVMIGQDGYFVAFAPDLRGCHTQTKSLDTLMKRLREVITLSLEDQKMALLHRYSSGLQRIRL